ncbi:MAG TPA: acyl-CoA dehydrogenase family protein [Myxococcaceae bacterium]|nr:acyl-CoA dehydrogenase family protein [Myxococcaceae bacterium]
MDDLLRFLLTAPPQPEPLSTLGDWWRQHCGLASRFTSPVEHAFAGGFVADRLGYAFASGYHCALRALFYQMPATHRAALCVTEAGGAHPSAMQTRLSWGEGRLPRLTGSKAFVTLGTHADSLFVVATEGLDAQGRNQLRVVMLDAHRPGVSLIKLPPLPFVPEIPHAELRLENVELSESEVLDGDGYTRYVKPFRTVEDCHVHAALLGWLLQVARRSGWPEPLQDEMLAVVMAIRGLTREDPTSSAMHVALGGVLDQCQRLVQGLGEHWERVDSLTRERWERDRNLLNVAGKARLKRREVARQRLARGEQGPTDD